MFDDDDDEDQGENDQLVTDFEVTPGNREDDDFGSPDEAPDDDEDD